MKYFVLVNDFTLVFYSKNKIKLYFFRNSTVYQTWLLVSFYKASFKTDQILSFFCKHLLGIKKSEDF